MKQKKQKTAPSVMRRPQPNKMSSQRQEKIRGACFQLPAERYRKALKERHIVNGIEREHDTGGKPSSLNEH